MCHSRSHSTTSTTTKNLQSVEIESESSKSDTLGSINDFVLSEDDLAQHTLDFFSPRDSLELPDLYDKEQEENDVFDIDSHAPHNTLRFSQVSSKRRPMSAHPRIAQSQTLIHSVVDQQNYNSEQKVTPNRHNQRPQSASVLKPACTSDLPTDHKSKTQCTKSRVFTPNNPISKLKDTKHTHPPVASALVKTRPYSAHPQGSTKKTDASAHLRPLSASLIQRSNENILELGSVRVKPKRRPNSGLSRTQSEAQISSILNVIET